MVCYSKNVYFFGNICRYFRNFHVSCTSLPLSMSINLFTSYGNNCLPHRCYTTIANFSPKPLKILFIKINIYNNTTTSYYLHNISTIINILFTVEDSICYCIFIFYLFFFYFNFIYICLYIFIPIIADKASNC